MQTTREFVTLNSLQCNHFCRILCLPIYRMLCHLWAAQYFIYLYVTYTAPVGCTILHLPIYYILCHLWVARYIIYLYMYMAYFVTCGLHDRSTLFSYILHTLSPVVSTIHDACACGSGLGSFGSGRFCPPVPFLGGFRSFSLSGWVGLGESFLRR